jgi:hypothetical protein
MVPEQMASPRAEQLVRPVTVATPDTPSSPPLSPPPAVAPDEYYCPITKELMVDPVIAMDGMTYEKDSIREWFQRQPGHKKRSPMSNELLR